MLLLGDQTNSFYLFGEAGDESKVFFILLVQWGRGLDTCTCCFALFVCLTLLASFFLPSHLSFKNMYINCSEIICPGIAI